MKEATSLETALRQLDAVAPDIPLLALGQTIFWDETMKGAVAQTLTRSGSTRQYLAGVHDTDYFAKASGEKPQPGKFKALPHNDTTTRSLWSAAGEFSALFGSETVITREMLNSAGLKIGRLQQSRPGFLDSATEAYGWKGIVSLDENAPVTADLPVSQLFDELFATLRWAIDLSVDSFEGEGRKLARTEGDRLTTMVCEAYKAAPEASLADLYEALLPDVIDFVAGAHIHIETTRTSKLLRFNSETCGRPRFKLLDLFLQPSTRNVARQAYNDAIKGSALYPIDRFGTGAVPFDVYIPKIGRGTLRIGQRGIVINTSRPQFLSLSKPVESVQDLARVLEQKFGSSCAIVGKAVALIGMLGTEHVFVFHEGASSYVKHSRKLHEILREKVGTDLHVHPILRLKYDAWSSLCVSCAWLHLPEPLRRPFGSDEICSPSFAARWQTVAEEQNTILKKLSGLHRPLELIAYLDRTFGGSWRQLAQEYSSLQSQLEKLKSQVDEVRSQRIQLYKERNRLKDARKAAETAMGDHFRSEIFDKQPSDQAASKRDELAKTLSQIVDRQEKAALDLRLKFREQGDLARDPQVRHAHTRRRDIELEAELKRISMIRDAVTASKGLEHANYRPSGWWFPMLSPDGLWFRETTSGAECYLEPLQ